MTAPIVPPQRAPPSDPGSSLFNKLWWGFFELLARGLGLALKISTYGTHADRLAQDKAGKLLVDPAAYQQGSLFTETDRGAVYQDRLVVPPGETRAVPTWVYISGEMDGATLANLPTDLGINDIGFLFVDEQFQHRYEWSGTVWSFASSDDHMAGQIAASAGGGAPLAGVWAACAGGLVSVSKGDGTMTSLSVPDLTGGAPGGTFLFGNTSQTIVNPGLIPTWQAGAKTDDESAHTHVITQLSINVPGSGSITNVDTQNPSSAGSAHHHTLSNANAKLNIPTQVNGGLPQNIGLVFYVRK